MSLLPYAASDCWSQLTASAAHRRPAKDCFGQSLRERFKSNQAGSRVFHNQIAPILIINRPISNYYRLTATCRFSSDLRTFLRYNLDLVAAPPEMV